MSENEASQKAADQSQAIVSQAPWEQRMRHAIGRAALPRPFCDDFIECFREIDSLRETVTRLRAMLMEIGCCSADWNESRYISIQVPHDLRQKIVEEGESG